MSDNKGIIAPNNSDISKQLPIPSQISYPDSSGALETSIQEPFNPVSGELALWKAVITQAMQDSRMKGKNNEDRHTKWQALHWLTARGGDFYTVCDFAGMNPDHVHMKIKEALKRGCKWRAEKRPESSG